MELYFECVNFKVRKFYVNEAVKKISPLKFDQRSIGSPFRDF